MGICECAPTPLFPTSSTVTTTTTTTTTTPFAATSPIPAACPSWVGCNSGPCVISNTSIHAGACYDPDDQAVVQCIAPSVFDTYVCPINLPFKCAYLATSPSPPPSTNPVCYNAL